MQAAVELVQDRLDRSGRVRVPGVTCGDLRLGARPVARQPADREGERAVSAVGVLGLDRVDQLAPRPRGVKGAGQRAGDRMVGVLEQGVGQVQAQLASQVPLAQPMLWRRGGEGGPDRARQRVIGIADDDTRAPCSAPKNASQALWSLRANGSSRHSRLGRGRPCSSSSTPTAANT